MNAAAAAVLGNSVHCRECWTFGDSEPPKWECFIDRTPYSDGRERAIVIFKCCQCGHVRYLDLCVRVDAHRSVPA